MYVIRVHIFIEKISGPNKKIKPKVPGEIQVTLKSGDTMTMAILLKEII